MHHPSSASELRLTEITGSGGMAGYDTITMSTTTPNDILRLNAQNTGHMLPMDVFGHDLTFGEGDSMFVNTRDDLTSNVPSLPFTPSYDVSDPFASTFDDPFSYQSAQYDTLLETNHDTQQSETTSPALDNKLLGFGAPMMKAPTLDDRGQTWPQMSAELYGMFFVAEDVFGGETTGRPMELTCYRRNLFQISGVMTLSRSISHVLNEQGQQIPLYDLTASISALESIEGKSTEIISVPWKTSAGASSEEKAGAAPAKWPLDLSMNPEQDPTSVTIPIAWKRLQFKHATANNGRRKGLQQHYVIQINLIATIATGEVVKLAEIQSGPIIVRGRSPRNFDSRKDVSLSDKKSEGKQRTMSDVAQTPTPQVKVDPGVTRSDYRFYTKQSQQPLDIPDWGNGRDSSTSSTTLELGRPAKKPSLSSSGIKPPVPKTRWNSDAKSSLKQTSQASPIDLSLADDEYGRKDSTGHGGRSGERSPEMRKKNGGIHVGSPVEDAELLYEYFPLLLDDWMPPVDAIYRPHVVHHIHPPEMMAQQVKGKQKRYFSADD